MVAKRLTAESGTGVEGEGEELDEELPEPWLEEDVEDDDPDPEDESTVVGVVAARLVLLFVEPMEERLLAVLERVVLVPLVLESTVLGAEADSP